MSAVQRSSWGLFQSGHKKGDPLPGRPFCSLDPA